MHIDLLYIPIKCMVYIYMQFGRHICVMCIYDNMYSTCWFYFDTCMDQCLIYVFYIVELARYDPVTLTWLVTTNIMQSSGPNAVTYWPTSLVRVDRQRIKPPLMDLLCYWRHRPWRTNKRPIAACNLWLRYFPTEDVLFFMILCYNPIQNKGSVTCAMRQPMYSVINASNMKCTQLHICTVVMITRLMEVIYGIYMHIHDPYIPLNDRHICEYADHMWPL